jgi:murein DD-endopeptidase MepM/ murein hydrolase activator NlpD
MHRVSWSSRQLGSAILILALLWLGPLWMSCGKRGGRPVDNGSNQQGQTRDTQYNAVANSLIDYLNKAEKHTLYATFHEELRASYSFETFSQHADGIMRTRGHLLRHGAPFFTGDTARFQVSAERGEWTLALRLGPNGRISAFKFSDPLPSIPVPSRNSVRLRLPFDGEWLVTSGGGDPSENHHVASDITSQVRAVDFSACDESGGLHRGGGGRNEDYYSYNQRILAPADGTVLAVIDGVPDNQPGKINPLMPSGNTLIVQHAAREYSAYFHLQARSICVKVGDHVAAGQTLGRCGNSGNTNSPHLHFQLMNSDVPIEATGFPPYFELVWLRRIGEKEASAEKDYTPRSGDRVRP